MTLPLPALKWLAGFEAAARRGHHASAAEELCISPSALSHQIAQLERHVGQALFRRKGRGLELTIAGQLLFDSVTASFETLRGGLDRIATYLDPDLITLVCPAPVAHGWLQPRLDRLMAQFPAFKPIVSVDESIRFVDQMDVDIAITREPLRQGGLCEVPLMHDALCMMAAPALAHRWPDEPQALPLLCLETDMTSPVIGPHLRQHVGHLRRAAVYDDPRLLLDAVVRGRGVALLSRLLADEGLRQGRLRLLDGPPPLEVGVLWMSRTAGSPRSPLVVQVFDALVRQAGGTATSADTP